MELLLLILTSVGHVVVQLLTRGVSGSDPNPPTHSPEAIYNGAAALAWAIYLVVRVVRDLARSFTDGWGLPRSTSSSGKIPAPSCSICFEDRRERRPRAPASMLARLGHHELVPLRIDAHGQVQFLLGAFLQGPGQFPAAGDESAHAFPQIIDLKA